MMETLHEGLGAKPTDHETLSALNERTEGPSNDGNETEPEIARTLSQKTVVSGPRTRNLRRTIVGTRSALRRRTISNAKIIRPLQRKLKFDVNQDDQEHDRATERKDQKHDDHISGQLHDRLPKKLSFKQRMKHFTWTWFTMTMATGGIANVL